MLGILGFDLLSYSTELCFVTQLYKIIFLTLDIIVCK